MGDIENLVAEKYFGKAIARERESILTNVKYEALVP